MGTSSAWPLEPISIAEHSYFWVGLERTERPDGTHALSGEQAYVEYYIPADRRQELPLVLVHGGAGQSTFYHGPGNGSPGWLHHALAAGYAVYLIDRPGHGRSPAVASFVDPQQPAYEGAIAYIRFGAETGRWPGTGAVGDPRLDDFMAAARSFNFTDPGHQAAVMRRLGGEAMDRIGPAHVVVSSAGGTFAWLMADERPQLVRTLVSQEAWGPVGAPGGPIPLTYDPPGEPRLEPLPDVDVDLSEFDYLHRLRQVDPPRKLVNLTGIRIIFVTSDDPRMLPFTKANLEYLRQAGCDPEELVLSEAGLAGNSHFAIIEENLGDVFRVVHERIAAGG